MNPVTFYNRYIAGAIKDHGTPPKVYGQMLKTTRKKRKIRKRNV